MGPKATLAWENVMDGKSTKQQMVEIAEEYKAGVLVIGLHGRKGPKMDHTILGSAVQHMGLYSPCPVLIVKGLSSLRSKTPAGKIRVAVCSDGSAKSIQALNFATRIIDRSKGDQIIVICVKTTTVNPGTVSDSVNKGFISSDNVPHGICRFVSLQVTEMMGNAASTICDYLS
jgi:nucleotide-binding universal stress UspA family protein